MKLGSSVDLVADVVAHACRGVRAVRLEILLGVVYQVLLAIDIGGLGLRRGLQQTHVDVRVLHHAGSAGRRTLPLLPKHISETHVG